MIYQLTTGSLEDILKEDKIKVINISEPAPSIKGPSGNEGDSISEIYIDENSSVINTFQVGNSTKYSTNVTWSLNGGSEESLFEKMSEERQHNLKKVFQANCNMGYSFLPFH